MREEEGGGEGGRGERSEGGAGLRERERKGRRESRF